MKRRILIVSAVVFVGLCLALVLLLNRADDQLDPSSSPGVAAQEVTIRNVTPDLIHYTVAPADTADKGQRLVIKAGAVHRLRTVSPLDVTFERVGRTVVNRLAPGRPYSFRLDEEDLLQIYEGSHGWEDVEDLAPFVATPMEVVEKMLELAAVRKGDFLFDLGCGDGRIIITAAQKFGCRGFGVDIDPRRIRESREGAKRAGVEHLVEFREADAMKVDISRATVLALYLLPESNALLRPHFESQLKPGVRVVSHNYTVPGWEDKEETVVDIVDIDGREHTVFLYIR